MLIRSVNSKLNRWLSILLSVVLLVTSMPGFVGQAAAGTTSALSSLTAGDTVSFANNDWIVLDPGSGYLLMKDAYGSSQQLDSQYWPFDPGRSSNLANYLNSTFLNTFSDAEKAIVKSTSWTTGGQVDEASSSVTCKIGLISVSEYNHYTNNTGWFPGMGSTDFSIINNLSDGWWTRTNYTGNSGFWYVDSSGSLNGTSATASHAVRPALYLDPSTLVSSGSIVVNASPAISNITLNPTSNINGNDQDVTVNITTSNVADGATVTASLVDSSKNSLSSPITKSGLISSGAAALKLSLPATLDAGHYYVMANVQGIADAVYTAYTISSPKITNVSLTPTGNIFGIAQSVAVEVSTSDVSDGTAVTASLVDSRKNELNPAITAASQTIASNYASLSLSVPATQSSGSYFVKVSLTNMGITTYTPFNITLVGINHISLTQSSNLAGSAQRLTATVSTDGIADGTGITVSFTDSAKKGVIPAITASGILSGNTADLTLDLPATLSAGSYFVKTSVDGISDATYTDYTINPSCLISVTASPSDAGTVSGGSRYAVGSDVTVTAAAASYYTFVSWTLDNQIVSTSSSYTFHLLGTADQSLVANFSYSGGSSGSGSSSAKTTTETELLPVVPVTPSVSTDTASNVTISGAVLNGSISDDGDAACSEVNFMYRLEGASTWKSTSTESGSYRSGDSFDCALSDLKANATYQFKARAYNTAGWGEGGIIEFITATPKLPQVSTQAATGISLNNATLQGTINNGKDTVSDCGFMWGTSADSLKKVPVSPGDDGSLSSYLSGLSGNTTYYYKAYATNMSGTAYGTLESFSTTLVLVITKPAANITKDSATLSGNALRGTGAAAVTECGFLYGTGSDIKTYRRIRASALPDFHDGSFTQTITGLESGAEYTFLAYAVSGSIESQGTRLNFTTTSSKPVVETRPQTALTGRSAALNGYITKNNGLVITGSGFLLGTSPAPTTQIEAAADNSDKRTLLYSLTGLTPNTVYYAQAYAVNAAGTGYGETISFTTPVTTPIVKTLSAVFETATGGATLDGTIIENGGLPISEYGFEATIDQQTWASLVVAKTDYNGDFTSATVDTLEALQPGSTYYIRAYAKNANATGYGEVLELAIPNLPALTGSISDDSIGATYATLAGTLTSTGGDGIICTAYRFQYREANGGAWINADETEGDIVPGTFSYKLDGLNLNTSYEFQIQAKNCKGWGSSPIIAFATTYGKTDKEGAVVMKAAGYDVAKIANILKSNFADSDVDAYQALQYAAYNGVDIAAGLKASDYNESAVGMASVLLASGAPVAQAADVLKRIYSSDRLDVAYNLVNGGYSIKDVTWVMKNIYGYRVYQSASALGGLSQAEVAAALYQVYGLNDLIYDYLWDKYSCHTPGCSALFISYLHMAGLSATELTNVLISYNYWSSDLAYGDKIVTPEKLAPALALAGYNAADTGTALVQVLGSDPPTVYGALTGLTAKSNLFSPADALDFLINNQHISLTQAAQVMGKWYPTQPEYDMSLMMQYYSPDAPELVAALYTGGWTKTGAGEKQIGLDIAVYYLVNQFKVTAPADIIQTLYLGGVSALDVAREMDGQMSFLASYAKVASNTDAWSSAWLAAYKQQGYTAADVAHWYPGDDYKEIALLNQLQYNLTDIVLGMKTTYNWGMIQTNTMISNANGMYRLGWTNNQIEQAVASVYGSQDLASIVRELHNEGDGATAAARYLQSLFAISDPVEAAGYLKQGGYNENDVLTAIPQIYAPINQGMYKEALSILLQIESDVYGKNGQINRYVLNCLVSSAGNEIRNVDVHEALAILTECNYSEKQIIALLQAAPTNGYGLPAVDTLRLITGDNPLAASLETVSNMASAFNTDGIDLLVAAARSKGYNSGATLGWLDKNLKDDIVVKATYLAGKTVPRYSKDEVLQDLGSDCNHDDYDLVKVMKELYGVSAESILPAFKHYDPLSENSPQLMCRFLMDIYKLDLKTSVLMIRDIGKIPVYDQFSGTWLKDFATSRNDALAAILGSAQPADLGLPAVESAGLLNSMGYSFEESIDWLLKNKYSWHDMFSPASGVYFPGKVWGDSEVSGLKALKGKYAITDLALGTYGGLGKYYWVYEDMIKAGFTFADVATAVVKIGGREGMIAVAGIMTGQHVSAKQIAATLVVICLNEPDISMSLDDVAYSLLVYGPNARSYGYSWSPDYSWYDLFQAVYVASAAFIQATGADAEPHTTALHILYLSGMNAYEGADIEAADGVGLSAGNMIMSMLGLSSAWFEAVENLASAGYGFSDSLNAVWDNDAYHMLIGTSLITGMIASSVSTLSMAPKISAAIKLFQNLDKVGFIINDTVKGNYKSAAIRLGFLTLSNIPLKTGGN